MSALQEACADMNQAAAEMHAAEYREVEACVRLASVDHTTPIALIDEWMDAVNKAIAARVAAQVHYAKCRTATRLAWEKRGEQ